MSFLINWKFPNHSSRSLRSSLSPAAPCIPPSSAGWSAAAAAPQLGSTPSPAASSPGGPGWAAAGAVAAALRSHSRHSAGCWGQRCFQRSGNAPGMPPDGDGGTAAQLPPAASGPVSWAGRRERRHLWFRLPDQNRILQADHTQSAAQHKHTRWVREDGHL